MSNKIEQAKKYTKLEAPNGFKFDLCRYLYGFAYGEEYPAFIKEIKKENGFTYYKRIYFFKYYDKSCAVFVETYSRQDDGDKWQIINSNPGYSNEKVEILPAGTRYSPKLLFKYCV